MPWPASNQVPAWLSHPSSPPRSPPQLGAETKESSGYLRSPSPWRKSSGPLNDPKMRVTGAVWDLRGSKDSVKLEREDLIISNSLLPLPTRRLFEGYVVSSEEPTQSCQEVKQPMNMSGKKTRVSKVRVDQKDYWNLL